VSTVKRLERNVLQQQRPAEKGRRNKNGIILQGIGVITSVKKTVPNGWRQRRVLREAGEVLLKTRRGTINLTQWGYGVYEEEIQRK